MGPLATAAGAAAAAACARALLIEFVPSPSFCLPQATTVSVTAAFCFYISSAVACYAALGDSVPGEVLEGFPQAPKW